MSSIHRLLVLSEEPIGTINPMLHGHFAEHLGELVYPGIYVDPKGSIPNTVGIRHDVVEALKPLGVPVLRWPGGCFADTYHWRDGIGPVDSRPMKVNTHWGMAEEPNHFGTHEFMEFCTQIGAEPYFAGNLGSGTPGEMRGWVEYCNFSGNSTLADERRSHGAAEPFRVKYWGVGNENWGCGGNMSPSVYAAEYLRYQTFVNSYPGAPVERIACGPNGNDWNWTEKFFEGIVESKNAPWRINQVQGFAAHYYAGTAGTATQYTEVEWLHLLARGSAIEGIITGHRSIMDRYDPERKIKLLLDEWGTWHPVEQGKPGGGLYQQSTIRDACLAALTLDIFNNHADKLFMANIAQLINVLQSLLLVEEDKCIKTPTFHVFDLYQPHKGAQAVRMVHASELLSLSDETVSSCRTNFLDRNFRGLQAVQGSASLRDKTICVTAVNSSPSEAVEIEVSVRGAKLGDVETVLLTTSDIHDHNTFDVPDKVKLGHAQRVSSKDGVIRVTLPPASVIRLVGSL